MRLLRGDGPPIRIGHRGAAALAPENTLEALRVGIAQGCDYVEFDVLSKPDGGLVLADSAHELPDDVATLDEALALLAAEGSVRTSTSSSGGSRKPSGRRCEATTCSSVRS